MRKNRIMLSLTMLIIVLALTLTFTSNVRVHCASEKGHSVEEDFYLRVYYTIKYELSLTYTLRSTTLNLKIPSPPQGFIIGKVELSLPEDLEGKVKVENVKLVKKKYDYENKRTLLVIYNVKAITLHLLDEKLKGKNVKICYTVYYVKESILRIGNKTLILKFDAPPKPFTLEQVFIELRIPEYVPYEFEEILTPNKKNICDLKVQEDLNPDDVEISPKEVKFKLSKLGIGKYSIKLMKVHAKPPAYIVRDFTVINDTLPPSSSKTFSIPKPPEGWNFSHVEVLIASITPFTPKIVDKVRVEADLGDVAFKSEGTIPIRLIRAGYLIKAYSIYSDHFKIINNLNIPILVYIVPFIYREVGEWTLLAGGDASVYTFVISKEYLGGAKLAYLYLDVPEGEIVAVNSPLGDLVQYEEFYLKAANNLVIRVGIDKAIVQIVSPSFKLYGSISFIVKWTSSLTKVLDSSGQPIVEGKILIEDENNTYTIPIRNGLAKLITPRPGIYKVKVIYRGVTVYENLMEIPYPKMAFLKCSVCTLRIRVIGARGQPLPGTMVNLTLLGSEFKLSDIANDEGVVSFIQIPAGKYMLTAKYKTCTRSRIIEVADNNDVVLKLDVYFTIAGIAFTKRMATWGILVVFLIVIAAVLIARRRHDVIKLSAEEDLES